MLDIGDLVTLSNNNEYIVVKKILLDEKDYVFLITKDGISDVMICKIQNDSLEIVKDENVINILLEKFRNE